VVEGEGDEVDGVLALWAITPGASSTSDNSAPLAVMARFRFTWTVLS
jgi:hypothetical protein